MLRSLFEACAPLFKPLVLVCAVTIGLAIASAEQGDLRATQAGKTMASLASCQTPVIAQICRVIRPLR